MPRKAVDITNEMRLTLGTYERTALKRSQNIKAAVGTAQAVAGIGLGAGAVIAAAALALWKAPDVFSIITNKTNGFLDNAADILLPGTPVEFRREAQALAARRAVIANAEASYCTFSSTNYSESMCSTVQMEKDVYFADLLAHQQRVKASTKNRTIRSWIWGGLGDIAPADPTSPEDIMDDMTATQGAGMAIGEALVSAGQSIVDEAQEKKKEAEKASNDLWAAWRNAYNDATEDLGFEI